MAREPLVDKAARKVQAIDKAASKVDKVSADLAREAARLDELSRQLASLAVWTRAEPGSRRPRFTRDEIASAAVRIADDEGFDALSMRRLAAELDAGTMTLYHYVRTKDELLTLVNDAIMGELIVPAGELPDDWRSAITLIALRSRDAMRRHPWALDIRDDPAPGPNAVRHFDQSMRAVLPLDISLGERFELITAVDEYVFGFCLFERIDGLGGDDDQPDMASYFESLIEAGDYPTLSAISAEHGFASAIEQMRRHSTDPSRFDRNLSRLLDGFEADFARHM
jgi:AcrR family transcriptional regulator